MNTSASSSRTRSRRSASSVAALLFREPLKLLDELGGLDGQRHRQVFRRVELLPIARGRERGEPLLQRA